MGVSRICIVGGGSAYMPGIAFALAHERERLDGSAVVLHDIDPDALELQRRLTERILASRGASSLRVEATVDRARAIDGADVVLTTFRPGGLEARHLDERIAIDHGVIGQETAGPGGFAMALRSVPVVLDVAREMRGRAGEGALLLNYTNPVEIVSEAMARSAPDVRYVGLCDQTAGERSFLARLMGARADVVELDTSGVNHMTFTRAVRIDGADATERIWNRLDTIAEAEVGDTGWWRVVRLFRVLRVVPSLYMQYFFFHDDVLAEQRAKGRTRAQEVMQILPGVVAGYRREADAEFPHPSMERAGEEHGDFAVSIAAALMGHVLERTILNLPNAGQVDAFPSGAIVETPAMVGDGRWEPIPQGPLPPEVSGLVQQVAEHARLTAEAALAGDRELAVRALAVHPLVRSLDTAASMVDAYLDVHAAHLPGTWRGTLTRPAARG